MTYKISGQSLEDAIVYLLQNNSYVGKKSITAGPYELVADTTSGTNITVVAENSAGYTSSYGNITAISGSDTANIIVPAAGAVIKSIQVIPPTRMPDGNFDPSRLVKDYTISAVDTSKTTLINVGSYGATTTYLPNRTCIRAQLINSTTVRLTRSSSSDPTAAYYYFTVLEYESGVKSIQRGSSTPATITISAVDTTKTIVHILGVSSTSNSATDWGGGLMIPINRGYLSSSTQLVLAGNAVNTISYEVVEFE
jgi:hypothetical protein